MNAASYYWSYIDFYTLITCTSYIAYIYNYDTVAGAEFRSSHRRFSQKTPALESHFYKVASLQACNVIKKDLLHRCFPVKFEKFLKTHILKNICERPLLCTDYFINIGLYNSLQYTFFIFTNNFFFITQLKQ